MRVKSLYFFYIISAFFIYRLNTHTYTSQKAIPELMILFQIKPRTKELNHLNTYTYTTLNATQELLILFQINSRAMELKSTTRLCFVPFIVFVCTA